MTLKHCNLFRLFFYAILCAMTTFELLQRIQQRLGEQTAFYGDAELVANGLNAAQNLLALARPPLLRQRTTLSVVSDVPFYDLRETNRRILRLQRVVLGTITGDALTPDSTTGLTGDLTPIAVARLASTRSDWFTVHGPVEHYWQWGDWLGVYPRPLTATTLTLVYDALPTPLTLAVPDGVPDMAAVYHPMLAEVAAALALIKEAGAEGQRGLADVARLLGVKASPAPRA